MNKIIRKLKNTWFGQVAQAFLGRRLINKLINCRYLRGDLKFQLKKNKKFKNIHEGKRCFIIGNGPSVKNMDFKLLENEIVFTVNQMSRVKGFEKLKTNYHLWGDDLYFSPTDNDEMVEIMKNIKTENSNPEVFYTYTAKPMIDNYNLQTCLNINYFKQGTRLYEGFNEKLDFTKVVPHCGTIIQYAIILAYYMGIKEIYLLGCECTGILKTIEKVSESSIGSYYAYEPNDKDKNNYSSNIIDEFYGHYTLLTDYGRYYDYLSKRNISLVNCTPGGILKNIPCKTLEEVLGNKEES